MDNVLKKINVDGTLYSIHESKVAESGGTAESLVTTGEKYTWNNKYDKPSNGIPSTDLSEGVQESLNKADSALQSEDLTKENIGLSNVTNDAQVKRSEMGVADGVATLDSTGKVPSTQLPSYVDDVIEGYLINGKLYNAEPVDVVEIGGVRWATKNIGAESETDYGNYYMYGKGATQYNSEDTPYDGTEDPLNSTADTATQVLGSNWVTPTKSVFEALIANTDYTWETDFNGSGINGGKFTDKTDSSKYVFFPAAGYYDNGILDPEVVGGLGGYWSSTPSGSYMASHLYILDGSKDMDNTPREVGLSIRPIYSGSLPTEITAEPGKIYVDKTTNKTYRWSGSTYVEISESLAIGNTQGTAFDGKTGNDHVNNTSNPHNVTATQIGLGNVGNFKAVSTEANQGLTSTEQSNARANIGAGTSSFSGSYNDLTDKPTIPTVPTNVSSFTNDAGYLTQHQDISGKANISDISVSVTTIEDGEPVTTQVLGTTITSDERTAWNAKVDSSDLATVATSGDYDDLINKPTIPVMPTIPTDVSSFNNDAGYLTSNDISGDILKIGQISVVTVSEDMSNVTCPNGITGNDKSGANASVIYKNSGTTDDYTITVSTSYTTTTGNQLELTCPAGGYCEVNYANVGGTIYARGV